MPRSRHIRRPLLAAGICLALLALSAPAAAQANATARGSVINGKPATIAEFPSLAFIEAAIGRNHGFACTGSVIAPRLILTAGHCVEDIETGGIRPAGAYAVATGVANLHDVTPANVFKVSKVLAFPDFDPGTLHGDAGLLVLATPTTAPALALATGADGGLYAGGADARLAGWGLTDPESSSGPAVLQATSTKVQAPAFCKKHIGGFYPFYSPGVQMCTADPPRFDTGGCFGDSGGPLMALRPDGIPVEVGIVSVGDPTCSTRVPNIFTRADRVSTWAGEWVAAIELGAPAPKVEVPKAELPMLTIPRAKDLIWRGLVRDFGKRFLRGQGQEIACRRLNRIKVKCGVSWFRGDLDYFGTVTVFYAFRKNSVAWKDRYTIRWVSDRCWFHSGHRGSCVIHSKHR